MGADFDLIYVPFFMLFCMEFVKAAGFLENILLVLGKYSADMWLIHGFYCYYFYAVTKIVCWTGNAIVDLFTLLALSFASAVAVNELYVFIAKNYKKRIIKREL